MDGDKMKVHFVLHKKKKRGILSQS